MELGFKEKLVLAMSLLGSLLAISGCSAVFDYQGYMVLDEDFAHHSHPEGARWSSKDFKAPAGKLYIGATPFESRNLWFGPIIPIFPGFLISTSDTLDTDFVVLQFVVTSDVPLDCDWNKVKVTTIDGQVIATAYSGHSGH